MKTAGPFYSRHYSLARIFLRYRLVAFIAVAVLSFSFTELNAQDATTTTLTQAAISACVNSTATVTATVADVPNPGTVPTGTVQLQVDGANSGGTVALAGGTANLTIPAFAAAGMHTIDVVYNADPTFQNSTSVMITETVNAAPVITYAGSPFCSNGGTGTVTLTGLAGGVYTASGGLTIDPVSGNITLSSGTGNFTITYTDPNGCVGTTPITINQPPVITALPATQTVCSGAVFATINFTSTIAGTAFNWLRDNTTNLIGMNPAGPGGTTSVQGALTNTTTTQQTSNFTIVATAPNGCSANNVVAAVVVNPAPTVAAIAGASQVCQGATIQPP